MIEMHNRRHTSDALFGWRKDLHMNTHSDIVCKRPVNEVPQHWAAPRTTFEIKGVVANGNNDHERLLMGNWDKYNEVSMRLFGDKSQMWWDHRTPEQVQEFLRQYWDDPELILVKIQRMYNVSNGFLVWNFSYRLSKL